MAMSPDQFVGTSRNNGFLRATIVQISSLSERNPFILTDPFWAISELLRYSGRLEECERGARSEKIKKKYRQERLENEAVIQQLSRKYGITD